MKNILFSESESYYVNLGLERIEGVLFTFDGMRLYKSIDLDEYDAFVCSFYSLTQNVLITQKFRELGKVSVIVADGVFDFSNSFYNPMHSKYDINFYFPIHQDVFITADKLSQEYYSLHGLKYVSSYLPKRMINKELEIGMSDYKKVLITTANTPYFNDMEFDRLASLILVFVELLRKEGVSYSFRIFDERLIKELASKLKTSLDNDIYDSFENILGKYSAVVTTPSSISLTAMYHQKPVMTLNVRDVPLNIQSGWIVSSPEYLPETMKNFLTPSRKRMSQQNMLLSAYLSDSSLSDELSKVLKLSIDREVELENFYKKMLQSKFNFNIEYRVRKIYHYFKGFKLVKKIRKNTRW